MLLKQELNLAKLALLNWAAMIDEMPRQHDTFGA